MYVFITGDEPDVVVLLESVQLGQVGVVDAAVRVRRVEVHRGGDHGVKSTTNAVAQKCFKARIHQPHGVSANSTLVDNGPGG